MKTKKNGHDYYDADYERLVVGLKRKGLDIEAFEIHSRRHEIKRSLEELTLANPPVDEDYIMFLKSILLGNESSSQQNEDDDDDSDREDDMDPQYTMFLKNVREDGLSYKLEIAMGNRMVSLMYEGEDDDKYDTYSPITSKNVRNKMNVEDEDYPSVGKNRGRVGDDVNMETNLKPVRFTRNSQSRDDMETRSSPRLCNNKLDSTKNKRNQTEKETKNFVERDLKSKALKDLKNVSRSKEVESPKFLRSVSKHVEDTRKDTKENSRMEKRKLEGNLKSRSANCDQAKMDEYRGKRSSAKWTGVFGCDWQHELNADDVDECYRIFLNSIRIEGDRVVYAAEGKKPVKHEALDVECSSDSEILETPKNELQQLRSRGGGIDSVFRKQLMAKLGEPYNNEEYKELWNEIKLERPKIKHYDLRGSRSEKAFHTEELSPSYLSTYAPLKTEIAAVGHDRRRRLNYLRGFFFWLQNVAHEDAFEPWLDKSCLEVMRKSC